MEKNRKSASLARQGMFFLQSTAAGIDKRFFIEKERNSFGAPSASPPQGNSTIVRRFSGARIVCWSGK